MKHKEQQKKKQEKLKVLLMEAGCYLSLCDYNERCSAVKPVASAGQ